HDAGRYAGKPGLIPVETEGPRCGGALFLCAFLPRRGIWRRPGRGDRAGRQRRPRMPVLSQNQRGALYMTISMLAFLINDSCLKALSDELPLMQAITLRGLGSTILLGV